MPQRLKTRFPIRLKDGTMDEVLVYVEVIDTSTSEGPSSVEGLMELRLKSGGHLNHRGRGRYERVRTGEILESNHPDAV